MRTFCSSLATTTPAPGRRDRLRLWALPLWLPQASCWPGHWGRDGEALLSAGRTSASSPKQLAMPVSDGILHEFTFTAHINQPAGAAVYSHIWSTFQLQLPGVLQTQARGFGSSRRLWAADHISFWWGWDFGQLCFGFCLQVGPDRPHWTPMAPSQSQLHIFFSEVTRAPGFSKLNLCF